MPIPFETSTLCPDPTAPARAGGFAQGVRIAVPGGTRAVAEIAIGDLVETLDHGPQPVRDLRQRRVPTAVCVSAGTLGNARDLVLAPQHGVLICDWRAALWTGCDEVLVAAGDLVDGRGVYRIDGAGMALIEIGFAHPEIILADGCACESWSGDARQARATADTAEVACLRAA